MHGPQRIAFDEAIAFLREEEANFAEVPTTEVQPLRDLAESKNPYRGNAVPTAKAAVTKLRGILAGLLKTERDQAIATLDAQSVRLQAVDDFVALDAAQRQQVMAPTFDARAAIQSARFVTGIRDRLQGYINKEYPAQLALASKLAAVGKSDGGTTSKATPVQYTPASSLKPNCRLPYLSNETELDDWLGALREVAAAELKAGKRISL